VAKGVLTIRNRYLEALKESYNVIGLTTAVAISAAALNPLPLLVWLVAEAAYLVFVPDSKWYEMRLAARYDAEVVQRREELKARTLPLLRPEMRERFVRLEEMRASIGAQGNEAWLREVLRKLDFLLEKFLQFASREVQFRSYLLSVRDEVRDEVRDQAFDDARADPGALRRGPTLIDINNSSGRRGRDDRGRDDDDDDRSNRGRRGKSGPRRLPPIPLGVGPPPPTAQTQPRPAARQRPSDDDSDDPDRWVSKTVSEVQSYYDYQLDELKQMAEAEPDPGTKAVLEKRFDVLQRRREFVGKIGRIQTNLVHQLMLLEDTFGLISDEIRARPPEQVLADIEDVVMQTNTMTQALEEVAAFDSSLRLSA
jgi:hypothetical protein